MSQISSQSNKLYVINGGSLEVWFLIDIAISSLISNPQTDAVITIYNHVGLQKLRSLQ